MDIVLIFLLLALLITLMVMRRNILVHNELKRVLAVVSILANKDVANGLDWRWRYAEFNTISYNKMLFELWKPVSSYFSSSRCCKDISSNI